MNEITEQMLADLKAKIGPGWPASPGELQEMRELVPELIRMVEAKSRANQAYESLFKKCNEATNGKHGLTRMKTSTIKIKTLLKSLRVLKKGKAAKGREELAKLNMAIKQQNFVREEIARAEYHRAKGAEDCMQRLIEVFTPFEKSVQKIKTSQGGRYRARREG